MAPIRNWRAGLVFLLVLAGLASVAGWIFWRGNVFGAARKSLPAPWGVVPASGDRLRDRFGNLRSIDDYRGHPAVVVCFLGTECPLANRVLPELLRLEVEYRSLGVQFLAVYSHERETLNDVAAHTLERRIPFAVLKDFGQQLANAMGVTRTPEFCLLDGQLRLCYRGRFSDQFTVNATRPQAGRADLKVALDEVLAAREVTVGRTAADGCLLDRQGPSAPDQEVTYSDHVAPLLKAHCVACHRPGGIGPFSLESHADAVRWAAMIGEVAWQRRMPPWHADPRFGHWQNDRRLSAEDINVLAAWATGSHPRGSDPDGTAALDAQAEWAIGQPDTVVEVSPPFAVPAAGPISYQYLWIPKPITDRLFSAERWMRASDIRPGVAAVTHHIMVYSVDPGHRGPEHGYDGCRSLGIFVPGQASMTLPAGTGLRIPRGSRLCFEMHYTPNGQAATDQPRIALDFWKEPPAKELVITQIDTRTLSIPPGVEDHQHVLKAACPADSDLLALYPHQHLRGKTFQFECTFPDGRRETLLSVPRMDFNWQSLYWFQEPLFLPQGAVVRIEAHWDNSPGNPYNPRPDATVVWGPQSEDEMMVGWLVYVFRDPPRKADDTLELLRSVK